jgi:hypothetical protein
VLCLPLLWWLHLKLKDTIEIITKLPTHASIMFA